ncbi:hypothetical protein CLF28_08630, partial [Campylobacter jejuni]|nr:hypothetical protein [Campylobacter jejuni]
LAFVIIPIIFNIVVSESLQNIAYIIAYILVIVNWTIWWIVDMFLVGKKLRKQNYEKIANIIQ